MLHPLQLIAQTSGYSLDEPSYTITTTSSSSGDGFLAAFMLIYVVGLIVLYVISIIGLWKVFTKAGQAGWKAIIPFYNVYVMLQIVGRPGWWLIFYFTWIIPFIGWIPTLVATIINSHDLAKSFGKDVGTTILLVLFPMIGFPYLGFGSAKYLGPKATGFGNPDQPADSTSSTPPAAPPTSTPPADNPPASQPPTQPNA